MVIGNPLSRVVANLFMGRREDQILRSTSKKPKIWWGYVDDKFVIWQHGRENLTLFLEHLSNVHPSIGFAVGAETSE